MEIFSALLALCAGDSPVTGEFPWQRPVTRSFVVFFDQRLNKHLSKQSWGWWFETPSCSLWRHCNDHAINKQIIQWWFHDKTWDTTVNPFIHGKSSDRTFGAVFHFYSIYLWGDIKTDLLNKTQSRRIEHKHHGELPMKWFIKDYFGRRLRQISQFPYPLGYDI